MRAHRNRLSVIRGSILGAWLVLLPLTSLAQTPDDAIQANNPLADLKAFNVQNYHIGSLSDGVGGNANTFWLRYAQPIGNVLVRASLPVRRVPVGGLDTESGLGDLDLFGAYLFDTGDPTRSYGLGPLVAGPSATEDSLGTGKWQAGVAGVYFDASSPIVQWGGLVTWQTDFAGDDTRADTNLLAAQPFLFVQLGNGLYLRGAPIWAFDIEAGDYHVPLSLGLGKVISAGSVVYNAFIEPQFTILDDGPGQPEFQLFMGLNLQFR